MANFDYIREDGTLLAKLGETALMRSKGKTPSEIAEKVNLPESTIRAWINEIIIPAMGE